MTETENLSFEQARDELRGIIQTLESGSAPLEETLKLWGRGEALAKKCKSILERAMHEIQEVQSESTSDAPGNQMDTEAV